MRSAVLILCSLLYAAGMGLAQTRQAKIERAAIQTAKAVLISTFDIKLPPISLEYFLDYEAGSQGSVDWEASPCPLTLSTSKRGGHTCVLATMQFRDGRVAMVSLAVSSVEKNVELRSVMILDKQRVVWNVPLIRLPAVLQRKWRRMPRIEYSSDAPA
ncbi:MAG: hypothetical protein L0Z53_23455 [Acidobacteriales bacterium]|nr:hypothetical protein [Terriglobales bacterium]